MSSNSKFLIISTALMSIFFVFPDISHRPVNSPDSLILLLLTSVGILISRMFILSSDSSDKTGIEVAVIVCIATWRCSSIVYPVTVFLTFVGSILNSIRMEKKLSKEVTEAIFQGISFAVLLKISSYLYWQFLSGWAQQGTINTYIALLVTALPAVILRTVSICFTGEKKQFFLYHFKKSILTNSFVLLLAVPSALAILRKQSGNTLHTVCSFSLFSMIVIYGISLRLNRAAHEKTNELETVLQLKELSRALFLAHSEMDALRTLSKAVSRAWGCRTAIQWKNVKYCQGEKWNTDKAIAVEHSTGLTIWVDSFSSTIPVYMESFLNRAVPVLASLEAEKQMRYASWESMETMISFVEKNCSDFAGFSRGVAATAVKLCEALETDNWFEDCMRLAGLLHMINNPALEEDYSMGNTHSLPPITRQALESMDEQWSGTGPEGKLEDEIPLSARILAVSIAWEKAIASGTAMAVRDINMKAGTLYDPRLAKLIIQLNS